LRVTKLEIAGLVPHEGVMCLLDEVVEWDASRVRCLSRRHRDADNPLCEDGCLSAWKGIEYAAQAMAVHGGLTRSVQARPRAGYLASLREVVCRRDRLDDLEGDLVVEAERLLGEGAHVIYRFTVWVGATEVLTGRAAVVLDVGGKSE
jgi:predicted hotdog family 3-hydroxylacyl-ACP dehydratase